MARAQLRARTILETLGRSHEDLFRLIPKRLDGVVNFSYITVQFYM
jgi:hypothetical protein